MNKQKGFTIIELIVVIAIIAVLAAIVLVNVTTYINKGKNAAIQGNMASLMTSEAAFYDQNSSTYMNATQSAPYTTAVTNAGGTALQYGSSAGTGWCLKATLLASGGTWCVDGTGYKGATATNCTSATSTSCQ